MSDVDKIVVDADLYEGQNRVVTAATVASATSGQAASASVNVVNGTAQFTFVLPKGDDGTANVTVSNTQPSTAGIWYNTGTPLTPSS